MASVDSYSTIGWKDAPEHQTSPLNSMNLGHMDEGILKNNQAIQALCTEVSSKAANNPTFTQASSRTNIESGESTSTLFGKIKKWFASLGNLAFLNKNGSTSQYLRGDGTWVTPPNTTYGNATTSAAGLMSASDKSKLNGIASGAQVNSVTGVKGNSESSYRTGNVNITKANIGLGNVDNTADANKQVAYASYANSAGTANSAISATTAGRADSAGYATRAGSADSAGYATRAGTWSENPGYAASNGIPKYNSSSLVTSPINNSVQLEWNRKGSSYGPFLKIGNAEGVNLIHGTSDHNIRLVWTGSQLDVYIDVTRVGRVVIE
jgi:hypothetical protein